MMTQKGEGVALGITAAGADDIFRAKDGIIARSDRVLMPAGIYPRMWVTKTDL
jgi:hypothetical protein